ncbi:hypothetical protein NNX28_14325 [Arthrobacter sp. zg-Y859]|uniref:SbsA Ig-like domain-containing protein n=1 Tax=Arthrobacter jinronghuae TaxID=2964609 RepID=A0ABT1NTN5_9MICC|nr:hypothetical protein [Arthrobacter jinronghuae]MCQ1951096.1 hypothetical protein [Arthrobacter jinronghuae]MCQ1957282.1 hypothetical protein [Arthrobacter jinronghuae]UWX79547.1 hypothetical protein N2K98_04925 [Arthrobacter jinronghuae]
MAFVLTVILGVGGPAAYAYWSASTNLSISGKTVRPPLPALKGDVRCSQPLTVSVVRIVFSPAEALPADVSVVATVAVTGKTPRSYVIPNNGVLVLKDLPGLADSLSWGDRMSISVTTAYVDGAPGNLPAAVDETKVLARAAQTPGPANAYYLASFFCS